MVDLARADLLAPQEGGVDAMMKYGGPEQVSWVPEIEAHGMVWADVWDIVKDLRHEGTVTLDGRTVLEGGKVLVG